MRGSTLWLTVTLATAVALAGAAWILHVRPRSHTVIAHSGYADPQTCVRCHRDEAAGFSETGMAHAFYTPTAQLTIDSPAKSREYYHATSATWFSITARDGRFYERRWQKGFDGRDDNVEELSIDYVMGSGNHARTYLHRERDGTLIELPLAWYSENGGEWAMNPGFDNATPQTRRVIAYECMFCHNAYPDIPPTAHRDLSARPVYAATLPQGIDCQRCHGPGAAHVAAAEANGTPAEKIRSTILNPSHLSNERQMQVCEQCHLETTSTLLPDRVRHYDQQPFGYDVNQPLSSFNAYFVRDPAHGRTDNVEIDGSAYRLRQSKCYIASKGALTCERCHDPHDLHKGPASAQYFANICMSCHADAVHAMVAKHQHPDSNQCVTCHMPQRRTQDVVHVVMTDHLIQRYAPNPKEALAPRREDTNRYLGPVLRYPLDGETPHSDDALYDAVAQVIDKSNVQQGVPKLEQLLAERHPAEPNFYIELGDAQHELKQIDAAIISYRKALRLDPASSRAARRLGVALGNASHAGEALEVLTSAISRDPDNEYLPYERAQIELRTGDTAAAEADLRKTLVLSPDDADALNNLGSLLARNGDVASAEKELRAALAVDPYNSDARANLGRLLLGKGAADEALFQLRKAADLAPSAPDILLDDAVALLSTNHVAEARSQVQRALIAAPRNARAFDLLGQIALSNRNPREALAQFQAALQADPTFAPAMLDLAETMIEEGDLQNAQTWLERAQQSNVPAVAQQASALLSKLQSNK